jgi:hypothetical protein
MGGRMPTHTAVGAQKEAPTGGQRTWSNDAREEESARGRVILIKDVLFTDTKGHLWSNHTKDPRSQKLNHFNIYLMSVAR